MKKIIAFGLSLMLLFQLSIPAVAMTFPGSAEAEKAENVNTIMSEELIELREPNSKTFQLSNGTYECIIYAEDMHYEDGRGNLSEIDNSIVRESYSFGDVTYAYRNAANKNIVHFAETEPKICISAPKGLLEFSFVNSEDTVATIGNHYSMHEFSICSLDGDNYIAYPDVYTQTDMVYAVENDLVKEYIILKGKNAPAKFLFRFNTEGLSVRKSDGVVQFYDEADTIVFELEKLFAVDAAGAYTNALEYNVIGTDGQFTLVEVSVSEIYLEDPAREFPIMIDPTVMITGSSTTYDTYASSKYPSTNYYTNTYLRTGKDDDYGIRRSYIKFDIPDYLSSEAILSAELRIRKYSGSTPTVTANRVTSTWTSSTLTWNNKPNYQSGGSSLILTSNDWYKADVTGIVHSWVNGVYSNYGFLLRDTNESSTSHWTTFYSSDAASPNKPELHISYSASSAQLIGVVNNGHDHVTWTRTVRPYLENCGFPTKYNTGAFTVSQIRNYLGSNENAVFISRSHGGKYLSNDAVIGTCIRLNDDDSNKVFFSSTGMNGLDLSNLLLVMFIGCKTGYGGVGGKNLPTVACSKGAKTAVGFKESIDCPTANNWTIAFCKHLENGMSVGSACSLLDSLATYRDTTMTSYIICGNQNTIIKKSGTLLMSTEG